MVVVPRGDRPRSRELSAFPILINTFLYLINFCVIYAIAMHEYLNYIIKLFGFKKKKVGTSHGLGILWEFCFEYKTAQIVYSEILECIY